MNFEYQNITIDGDKTYYHFNAHGDVVALTNANGNKTKSYFYSAFGVEYNESTLDDNPFRYCGEYYDKETKTIYLRARYYDANQGRFTQEDPIRDGDNWYSYCDGNPIMFVDPSGLSKGFSEKNRIITQKLNEYLSLESPSSSESLVPPSTNFSVEQQNDLSTGLLIAAGVSAASDGPLPIGDIVGIVLFGIAAVTAMMTTSTAITTAPSISLPEIRIKSKSEKQIAAKVEADTKIRNTVTEDSIDRYWMAYRDVEKDVIIITIPLSEKLAIEHVKAGGSIFTVTQMEACLLAYKAGGYVEPWYDGIHDENEVGYYYHYHLKGHLNGAHIWYLF